MSLSPTFTLTLGLMWGDIVLQAAASVGTPLIGNRTAAVPTTYRRQHVEPYTHEYVGKCVSATVPQR